MSWGIDMTGTKDAMVAAVTKEMDKIAATYEGKEEGKDVLAIKDRILSLIAATELVKDTYTDWNGVMVKASGSHSSSSGGIWNASFQVAVTRTSLKL